MRKKILNLINAISCEGLESSTWGVVKDIKSTREHFGTKEDEKLEGDWMYVYDKGALSRWFKRNMKEDKCLNVDEECNILFFKV